MQARSAGANTICSRCSSRLHASSNCPHIWRIYIRKPHTSSTTTSPKLRFACYNCASSEHFGDDCIFPRAHPIRYADRTAFTVDENRVRLGPRPGQDMELEYGRDKLPRPNIINGVKQSGRFSQHKRDEREREELRIEVLELSPPPKTSTRLRGRRGRGWSDDQQDFESGRREEQEDDLNFSKKFRANREKGEDEQEVRKERKRNTMASPQNGPERIQRNRGNEGTKWEPFKKRQLEQNDAHTRQRSRSRSPIRHGESSKGVLGQHLRFEGGRQERKDERWKSGKGDSYRPSNRTESRNAYQLPLHDGSLRDRMKKSRGSEVRPDSPYAKRGTPSLFDRIDKAREETAREAAHYDRETAPYQSARRSADRTLPPSPRTSMNDTRKGGRYRGGYV